MDINFVIKCKSLVSLYGVTSTKRTWVTVGSINKKGEDVIRQMWLAENTPPLPQNDEIWLWFNPVPELFYKSSNWKSGAVTWEQIDTYELLFNEDDGSGTGASVTSILEVLQTNPNLLDTAVQQALASLTQSALTSIQSLNELREIPTTGLPDKAIRFVEDENELYAYDAQSSATQDIPYIIVPNSATGRWNRVNQKILDGGTF